MSKSFFDQIEYAEKDIRSLIDNEIEESLRLEYKSSGSLSKSPSAKKEIGRDVSSFANSDGGIIVYGVEEKDHKPIGMSFIDGHEFNKEWLENIISDNIRQTIREIEIIPIRFEQKIDQTVYVVKIGRSEDAPHMCAFDKRYYRRYNFKAVVMEEYEIRQLYSRTSYSEMDFLRVVSIPDNDETNAEVLAKEFTIYVENISNSIEKHCKIELSVLGIDKPGLGCTFFRDSNINQKYSKDRNFILTAYNEDVIFPEEEYVIMRFVLKVNRNILDEARELGYFDLTMYDSSTTKKTKYELKELLGEV